MNNNRRSAVAALAAAGMLWGTTVPLSKLALGWLPPGWLTVARFGLAAAVLLVMVRRNSPRSRAQGAVRAGGGLRAAGTPLVLLSGAAGYGGSVILQNYGVALTSVTHAALLIGAVPVLVAVIAAVWQRAVARPVAWLGFGVSLAGVGLVTGGHGGGASAIGDGLVLLSVLVSATFTVGQNLLLRDRDPIAVTAVQFLGAALAALLYAVIAEGLPPVHRGPGAGHAGAGRLRHAGPVHPVRLRPEADLGRSGRGLPQPRTAGRRAGRSRRVRRPGGPGAGGWGRHDRDRHSLELHSAAGPAGREEA
jgi:O-acetylserine/cysteine efflux transporter